MSLAPATTPFLTTDQKGSLAWPWLTTMIWMFSAEIAGAAKAAAAMNVAAAAMVVLTKLFMRFPPSWATLPAQDARRMPERPRDLNGWKAISRKDRTVSFAFRI